MSLLPASSVPKTSDAEGAMQPGISSLPDTPAQKSATKAVSAPASMALRWERWVALSRPCTSSRSHVGCGVKWICCGCHGNARHTSLNLEESTCLPRLRSGRDLIPNQHKSKEMLCVRGPELWKSQLLILVGVCGWQVRSPERGSALGHLTGFTELET